LKGEDGERVSTQGEDGALKEGVASVAAAGDSRSRARRLVALGAGALFSGLCFYYLSRKIGWGEFTEQLRGLNVVLLAPAAVCVVLSIALRGYRWGLMLPRGHLAHPAGAIRPVAIALALNGVLPGKAGEVMRIVYARFTYKLPVISATTSVLAERLVDMAALCMILGVALVLKHPAAAVEGGGGEPELRWPGAALAGGVLLAALAGGWWARRRGGRAAISVERVDLSQLPFTQRIGLALEPMRDVRTAVGVAVASLAAWMILAGGNYCVGLAFTSFPLSIFDIMALTSVSIIASALPSIPGAWGVFEGSVVAAAPVLGVVGADAELVSFALIAHFVQYAMVLALGGACGLIESALYR
jgi:glycosyltransferase 2 family protein